MSKIPFIHQRITIWFDVSSCLTFRPGHFRAELTVIRRKADWSPEECPHVSARISVHALAGTQIINSVSEQYSYSTIPQN